MKSSTCALLYLVYSNPRSMSENRPYQHKKCANFHNHELMKKAALKRGRCAIDLKTKHYPLYKILFFDSATPKFNCKAFAMVHL